MKNTIIIRKNQGHIWFVRMFSLCALGILCWFAMLLAQWEITVLLCIPVAVPVIVLMVYYETWQISLTADTIQKKCMFFHVESFSYTQITDAAYFYSHTEDWYVQISFQDRRVLRFRMICDNAEKAAAIIQKHRSIRYS